MQANRINIAQCTTYLSVLALALIISPNLSAQNCVIATGVHSNTVSAANIDSSICSANNGAWTFNDARSLPLHSHSPAAINYAAIAISPEAFSAESDQLLLPLFEGLRAAQRTHLEKRDNGGWSWFGKMVGDPDSSISLTQHKGHYSGRIHSVEGVYEIAPSAAGTVLNQLDTDLFDECLVEASEPSEDHSKHTHVKKTIAPMFTPPANKAINAITTMDVFVAYSTAAMTGAGGQAQIETVAQQAVDSSNTTFINSAMDSRFRLVGVRELTDMPDNTGGSTMLNFFAGSATAQAWRNETFADLMGVIVQTFNPSGCGIARVQRTVGASFNSNAYQVTQRSCAVGNLSYIHEHGHNMGMEHNPEDGGSSPSYPYSYAHYVNGSYRTVMSYSTPCTSGCTRRPYFSNPNISYLGTATGIANARHNARTGDNTLPTNAQFRVPPLPAANFNHVINGLAVTFTDSSAAGAASITIASRAWNFGNGATSTANNPVYTYPSAGTYTVQLTVTDSRDGVHSTTRSVLVNAGVADIFSNSFEMTQ